MDTLDGGMVRVVGRTAEIPSYAQNNTGFQTFKKKGLFLQFPFNNFVL